MHLRKSIRYKKDNLSDLIKKDKIGKFMKKKRFYISFRQSDHHNIYGKYFNYQSIATLYAYDEQEAIQIAGTLLEYCYADISDQKPDIRKYPRGFIRLN